MHGPGRRLGRLRCHPSCLATDANPYHLFPSMQPAASGPSIKPLLIASQYTRSCPMMPLPLPLPLPLPRTLQKAIPPPPTAQPQRSIPSSTPPFPPRNMPGPGPGAGAGPSCNSIRTMAENLGPGPLPPTPTPSNTIAPRPLFLLASPTLPELSWTCSMQPCTTRQVHPQARAWAWAWAWARRGVKGYGTDMQTSSRRHPAQTMWSSTPPPHPLPKIGIGEQSGPSSLLVMLSISLSLSLFPSISRDLSSA
mmetsp:Transcript_12174/g.19668  ORF Transcript_12174/g.19668 Transcript_12174/m.19668 type:complete len:251 (+) Transcript_12174:3515-4267(+)